MFPPHLKYLHDSELTWYNPCWGYFGFWKRLDEFQKEYNVDLQTAWMHRDMKKNKEKYSLALAAHCMQQDAPEKYGWWFTKTLQDPPDGIIGTSIIDKKTGGNIMRVREVEIVEYFKGSLLDTIQKKLSKKRYEPNTILICLLSPENITEFDFLDISKELEKMSLSLGHIFVVFHGFRISSKWKSLTEEQKIEEMGKISFVQLAPKYSTVNVSPNVNCKAFLEGKERAWLKFTGRGRDGGLYDAKLESAPILFD